MIRIYSDPLIALKVGVFESEAGNVMKTTIEFEDPDRELTLKNRTSVGKVSFYGKAAYKAKEAIAKGSIFNFRGYVYNGELIGTAFTLVQ